MSVDCDMILVEHSKWLRMRLKYYELHQTPNESQKAKFTFCRWSHDLRPHHHGKTKKMRLRTRVWAQAPKPSSFAEKYKSALNRLKFQQNGTLFCWNLKSNSAKDEGLGACAQTRVRRRIFSLFPMMVGWGLKSWDQRQKINFAFLLSLGVWWSS